MSNIAEHNPEQAGIVNRLGITFPETRLGQVLELLFWLGFGAVVAVVLPFVAWLLFGPR